MFLKVVFPEWHVDIWSLLHKIGISAMPCYKSQVMRYGDSSRKHVRIVTLILNIVKLHKIFQIMQHAAHYVAQPSTGTSDHTRLPLLLWERKKNLSQFPWPILVGEKIPQHFPDFFRLPKYPNNPRYSQLVDTLDNTYKQNKTKHTLLATLAHYSSTLNWSGEYSRSGRTTSVQCRIFSFSDTLIFLKDGKYGREIWWGKLGCTLKWVPLEACATHIKN